MKCPNCGAPMRGNACPYCGTTQAEAPAASGKESPQAVPSGRGKRNLIDKILLVLGSIWCLICLVVGIDLQYWHSLTEIIATLMAASPGIVLILIGGRRKKEVKRG